MKTVSGGGVVDSVGAWFEGVLTDYADKASDFDANYVVIGKTSALVMLREFSEHSRTEVHVENEALQERLTAAQAEADLLRVDAERYRFIRDSDDRSVLNGCKFLKPEYWDADIDAAIESAKVKERD